MRRLARKRLADDARRSAQSLQSRIEQGGSSDARRWAHGWRPVMGSNREDPRWRGCCRFKGELAHFRRRGAALLGAPTRLARDGISSRALPPDTANVRGRWPPLNRRFRSAPASSAARARATSSFTMASNNLCPLCWPCRFRRQRKRALCLEAPREPREGARPIPHAAVSGNPMERVTVRHEGPPRQHGIQCSSSRDEPAGGFPGNFAVFCIGGACCTTGCRHVFRPAALRERASGLGGPPSPCAASPGRPLRRGWLAGRCSAGSGRW